MSKASVRIRKRKAAKQIIQSITEQRTNYLIIHYSCESFIDIPDGRTPRITSIAVMDYETGQTKSFSIHKVAEVSGERFDSIKDKYDVLEKVMLKEFSQFVDAHRRFKWIHLNMRNVNFGFEAISHRYMALGGRPIDIDDNTKIDIGRVLSDMYGPDYIPHPRIEALCHKNTLTMTHFLTGGQEAKAFEDGEYVKLHQSTLRKVENLHIIIERASEGTLKTDSTLIKLYGISPQSIYQMAQENWILAVAASIITLLLSALISKIF